jgi:endonuclease/exonuclease/phosphatase family metal-dependent hydrolase
MRVMSWNLWWRFGGNWRARQHGILATLRELRPDVAGLQEVWAGAGTSQAELLAGRLGMHAAFAAPSLPPPPVPPEAADQAGVEVGVAVLSRWPILAVREHRLPSANREQPVALLATLDHPAGPRHVMASCVEWEPAFAEDHLAQTRALAGLLLG